jgi:hypothetical protein
VRIAFLAFLTFVATTTIRANELERFWREFPGFKNTLASYGYDRYFSASAKPEFVDAVIQDMATNSSEQRLVEYLCVLYYMDAKTISDRLAALELSPRKATRRAVACVRKRLKEYGRSMARNAKIQNEESTLVTCLTAKRTRSIIRWSNHV